tara:strand:- start:2362 stop:2625 length:264 start_codon:yes stop_codon:yes gene_type:complete
MPRRRTQTPTFRANLMGEYVVLRVDRDENNEMVPKSYAFSKAYDFRWFQLKAYDFGTFPRKKREMEENLSSMPRQKKKSQHQKPTTN